MVNGMANRETSELGGEGVAAYFKGIISWVFNLIWGAWGHGQGGIHFFHLQCLLGLYLWAVMMWGGCICKNDFLFFWLACLEVAVSLRVMRPTRSDARLNWGRVNVVM